MKDDPIGAVLFMAGLMLLVGFVTFFVLLWRSRREQAKKDKFKLHNGMNENMDELLRWNGELQTPITYWAYNPYRASNMYDFVMNSIRTSRDKNSAAPEQPKPEPDQPVSDRDFIRFGPRV